MSDAAMTVIDGQPHSAGALVPVMDVDEARRRLQQLQEFIKGYLVEGEDYGQIEGTQRPTLYKPGAEKLCEVYGLAPVFDVMNRVEDWESGFFHYEVHCRLVNKRTGEVVAVGVGSCNNREARYAYRWVPEWKLPKGFNVEGLPVREREGRYGSYKEYRVPNDDPYTLVNTILKMAKKRAHVDATLSATRSSALFTQDLDEMADDAGVEPSASHNRGQRRSAKSAQGNGQPRGVSNPDAPATEAQLKAIYAIARNLDISDDERELIKQSLLFYFDVGSTKELTRQQASDAIELLKRIESGEDPEVVFARDGESA